MSTTLREAERVLGFLRTASEIEGKEWFSGSPSQKEFQVLLVKNRQFLNDPENTQSHQRLNDEQCKALDDVHNPMTYEMAESIIEAKNYEGGPEMRGRQSMSPLVKLGLVYYKVVGTKKYVCISDVGRKLLSGEIRFDEFMLDSLLKYQYPNPSERGYRNWNTKPFINTLRLIKEVNRLCEAANKKQIGISILEFGIFALSLKSYEDVPRIAWDLLDFRNEYNALPSEEQSDFVDSFIEDYLSDFNNPVKNCREYTDNMIRYLRLTKYIFIHGKYDHTYIDLEPRRMTEINAILQTDQGAARRFSQDEWNKYMGTFGSYVLPFETVPELKRIAMGVDTEIMNLSGDLNIPFKSAVVPEDKDALKKYIEDRRLLRTELQNLLIKKNVHKDLSKIDEAIEALNDILRRNKAGLAKKYSIELEKWSNVALNILNDSELIKPNAPVGDDNEPIYTAASGVPDIECYYRSFNAICEVTMLQSRDQWFNEGQPVMRHLRHFETTYNQKPAYCLFVAPKLHEDTVNTFYTSVKYEYDGQSQKIIPITIRQLISLLLVAKNAISSNKALSHTEIQSLYDSCVDMSNIRNTQDWMLQIGSCIDGWVRTIR